MLFQNIPPCLPCSCTCRVSEVGAAGDFPLINNVGSIHHTQKSIRDSECWMVIGWCKKLTRGQRVDQSHGPYISWCLHQKHHNLPCFGSSNPSVAPSSGEFWYGNMALKQPEVIKVSDDDDFPNSGPQNPVEAQSYRDKQPEVIKVPDDDDFPNSGPQNPVEAQSYRDKLNAIMNTFSDLLADDCKDALRSTITSLKKLMVKHWQQMVEADVDAVLKSIHNPSCIYLHQHLTTEGINVMEPVTEVPEGWTFFRQLPKKVWKTEVQELIMMCFNHLSEVHAHMSSFLANMSSLAKIANPETFDMVMKVAAQPMIQINVPEHYLSLVQDPPLKMTAEGHLSQLEKVLLNQPSSLAWEPWYRPTRLLAVAIWLHLKCKFFNGGTTKEACTTFEVQAKQLSKLLSGKVYLSGANKGKQKWSHTTAHEGDVAGDEPPLPLPRSEQGTPPL